jgi:hypothetical protein
MDNLRRKLLSQTKTSIRDGNYVQVKATRKYSPAKLETAPFSPWDAQVVIDTTIKDTVGRNVLSPYHPRNLQAATGLHLIVL